MRKTTLSILLAASMAIAAPVRAETDIEKALSQMAQSFFNQQVDRNAYVEAQSLNTIKAYRNYLAQFPKGAYRVNANQALAKLGATQPDDPPPVLGGPQTAAMIEGSIGLSRSQRTLIQKQLTLIGYPTGVADGLWGSRTRRAISQWQTANKLSATSYVTARQVRLIGQQAGTKAGADPEAPAAVNDAVEERLLGLTYAERREIQQRLTLLGYDTRGADGAIGYYTRRALAAWQHDQGQRASGYLTADQLRLLRRQSGL